MGYCNRIEVNYANIQDLEARLSKVMSRASDLDIKIKKHAKRNQYENVTNVLNSLGCLTDFLHKLDANKKYLKEMTNCVSDINNNLRNYYSFLLNFKESVFSKEGVTKYGSKFGTGYVKIFFSVVGYAIKQKKVDEEATEDTSEFGEIDYNISSIKEISSLMKSILDGTISDDKDKKKAISYIDKEIGEGKENPVYKELKDLKKDLSLISTIIKIYSDIKGNYEEYGEVTPRMVIETGSEVSYDIIIGEFGKLGDIAEAFGDAIAVSATHDKDATLKEVSSDLFADFIVDGGEKLEKLEEDIAHDIYNKGKEIDTKIKDTGKNIYDVGKKVDKILSDFNNEVYNECIKEKKVYSGLLHGLV